MYLPDPRYAILVAALLAGLVSGSNPAAAATDPGGAAGATVPAAAGQTAVKPTDGVPESIRARPTGRPSIALSAELPGFKAGQWQFRRTVNKPGAGPPQTSNIARCSDPTREMRKRISELETKGCLFDPPKRNGSQYDTRWTCTAPSGPVRFHDVIIVQGDTAYQIQSEALANEQVSRSTVDALRVGDCGMAGVTGESARQRHELPGTLRQGPRQ